MKIEPVNQRQVDALERAIGPMGSMICDLDQVDLSRGRGVLDGMNRCLWTKDGRRITISLCSDGSCIAGCAKEPDPELASIQANHPDEVKD